MTNTARLAELTGAVALGASDDERDRVELAGLVHDVGRVAVSNAVWDKRGPLGRGEMEQVRTHAFHTDRILAAIGGAIGESADAVPLIAGSAALRYHRAAVSMTVFLARP